MVLCKVCQGSSGSVHWPTLQGSMAVQRVPPMKWFTTSLDGWMANGGRIFGYLGPLADSHWNSSYCWGCMVESFFPRFIRMLFSSKPDHMSTSWEILQLHMPRVWFLMQGRLTYQMALYLVLNTSSSNSFTRCFYSFLTCKNTSSEYRLLMSLSQFSGQPAGRWLKGNRVWRKPSSNLILMALATQLKYMAHVDHQLAHLLGEWRLLLEWPR